MTGNQRGVYKCHFNRFAAKDTILRGWEVCSDDDPDFSDHQKEAFSLFALETKCRYLDRSKIILAPHFFHTTPAANDKTTLSDLSCSGEDCRLAHQFPLPSDSVKHAKGKDQKSTKSTSPAHCTFRYVQTSTKPHKGSPETSSNTFERVKRLIYLTNSYSADRKHVMDTINFAEEKVGTTLSHNAHKENVCAAITSLRWAKEQDKELGIKMGATDDAHCGMMRMLDTTYKEAITKLREQQKNSCSTQIRNGPLSPLLHEGIKRYVKQLSGNSHVTQERNMCKEGWPSCHSVNGKAASSLEERSRIINSGTHPHSAPARPENAIRTILIRTPRKTRSIWSQRNQSATDTATFEGQIKSDRTSVSTFVRKENELQATTLRLPAFHPSPLKVPVHSSASTLPAQSKKGQRYHSADRCNSSPPFPPWKACENDYAVPTESHITLSHMLHVIRDNVKQKQMKYTHGPSKM